MSDIAAVSWGIKPFDQLSGGVPAHLFNVVETPDFHSGSVILGQFIHEGLRQGERCAIITFESATSFLENFANWDLRFHEYLVNEQLYFLNYQPNVGYEAGLTHDYDSLLNEVSAMCSHQMPHRLALHQVDTLVNLNNAFLMNTSAQKLSAAAVSMAGKGQGPTILGQFVKFDDATHQSLSVAFQKTVHGYYALQQPDPLRPSRYTYQAKKTPWFNFVRQPTELEFVEGEGFQLASAHRSQVA